MIVADALEQQVVRLISSVADDLAWLEVTEDGFISEWSDPASRVFGYNSSEALGKPFHMLVGRPYSLLGGVEKLLLGAKGCDRVSHEIPFRTKTGNQFPAKVYLEGSEGRVLVFLEDLSGRRVGQRKLSNMLDALSDAVFLFDAEERYIGVNQAGCQLLCIHRDALIGRKPTEVFPSTAGSPFYKALLTSIRERRHQSLEAYSELLKANLRITAHPLEDGGALVLVGHVDAVVSSVSAVVSTNNLER